MSEVLTLSPLARASVLAGVLSASVPALAQNAPASTTDLGNIEIRSNRDNTEQARRESTALDLLASIGDVEMEAKARRALSIEDLRDTYSVSYETAAHRFTNLATVHLGIPVHFLKVHESGTITKAYENDDVNFPTDRLGSIEGQMCCRRWTSRVVFDEDDRFNPYYQYTDTGNGTYWCTARVEQSSEGAHSVSVGVRFDDTKWFRGRDTPNRAVSRHAVETAASLGVDADVVQYLKQPLDEAQLHELIAILDDPVTDLVRRDATFKGLALTDEDVVTADQVVAALVATPKLMQRPVLVRPGRAISTICSCRPSPPCARPPSASSVSVTTTCR